MTERRYSDEEFALILRKATELQARPPGGGAPTAPTTSGMSLEEIQTIAREVGIDPSRVAQAAGMIGAGAGPSEGVLTTRYVLADAVPGPLTDEDRVRVIQAIREAAAHHGESTMDGSGVEWSTSAGDPSQIRVSVYPLDERREVRVSVDRSAAAILTHILPPVGGLLLGAVTAKTMDPAVWLAGAGIVAGGAAGGLALGRAIWSHGGRRIRERAQGILGAVSGALRLSGTRPLEVGGSAETSVRRDPPPLSADAAASSPEGRVPASDAPAPSAEAEEPSAEADAPSPDTRNPPPDTRGAP